MEGRDAANFAEQRFITLVESQVKDVPEEAAADEEHGEILEELQEVFEVRDTPAIGAAFLA